MVPVLFWGFAIVDGDVLNLDWSFTFCSTAVSNSFGGNVVARALGARMT